MARRYMHWLRHENHGDHRVDTIKRTHRCECNECLSARNNGQPDPDQSILKSENEWFDQEAKVLNHFCFMKNRCEFSGATALVEVVVSKNRCEFSGAIASVTAEATGQAAQAGVSSAGTGAGCSAVMNVSAEAECLDLAGSASAGNCSRTYVPKSRLAHADITRAIST